MSGASFLAVLVVGFAAYRAARLLARDTISQRWRTWLLWRGAGGDYKPIRSDEFMYRDASTTSALARWAFRLFDCPLCVGVWCSAALYVAWRESGSGSWVRYATIVLAVAGLQCVLATREP